MMTHCYHGITFLRRNDNTYTVPIRGAYALQELRSCVASVTREPCFLTIFGSVIVTLVTRESFVTI